MRGFFRFFFTSTERLSEVDLWDQKNREIDQLTTERDAWREFGNATMRDLQRAERETLEMLTIGVSSLKETELRGEARAYRNMQLAMEIRGKSLGIELKRPN